MKSDAGGDHVTALEAVIAKKRFVGRRFVACDLSDTTGTPGLPRFRLESRKQICCVAHQAEKKNLNDKFNRSPYFMC